MNVRRLRTVTVPTRVAPAATGVAPTGRTAAATDGWSVDGDADVSDADAGDVDPSDAGGTATVESDESGRQVRGDGGTGRRHASDGEDEEHDRGRAEGFGPHADGHDDASDGEDGEYDANDGGVAPGDDRGDDRRRSRPTDGRPHGGPEVATERRTTAGNGRRPSDGRGTDH